MKLLVHKKSLYQLFIASMFAILAIWIGARDISVGADTQSYTRFYVEKASCKCIGSKEIGFEFVGLLPAFSALDVRAFFTLVSLILFSLTLYVVHRTVTGVLAVDPASRWRLYIACSVALLGTLMLNPLYTQSHINALRQGLASLCLVVVALELSERRLWPALLWGAIAVSFHLSAALHIPFLLVVAISLGRRPVMIAWVVTLFASLYLMGVSESIVKFLSPDLFNFVDGYGSHARGRYQAGVRWDFAIFTYLLVIGSLWSLRLPYLGSSQPVRILAEAACLSSIPFYILGWGVFSNRYLFSSWLMFSVFIGVAIGGLIRSKAISLPVAWALFGVGTFAFIYQISVG